MIKRISSSLTCLSWILIGDLSYTQIDLKNVFDISICECGAEQHPSGFKVTMGIFR